MSTLLTHNRTQYVHFDELEDTVKNPDIELSWVNKAGYTEKERPKTGLFASFQTTRHDFYQGDEMIDANKVYAAALKLKQEQAIPVTSITGATNGNKADPFGSQLPSELTVAIPTFGSTRTPDKAANKTPAAPATNSNGPKIGILTGTPTSSSSVPAAAQPAQHTAPPQPKVEVDYARIDKNVEERIKSLRSMLENIATEADLQSTTERMENIRDEIANMMSNHFRPANGDDPGGIMTVLIQDVNFLKKRVKADEQSAHDEGYQEGFKDAETNKFWVAFYSILGVTIVVLLAGFFVLSML